jgi:hypothetical protein
MNIYQRPCEGPVASSGNTDNAMRYFNSVEHFHNQTLPSPTIASWARMQGATFEQPQLAVESPVRHKMAGPSNHNAQGFFLPQDLVAPPYPSGNTEPQSPETYFLGDVRTTLFDSVDPNGVCVTDGPITQRQPMSKERKIIEARARRKQKEAADRLKDAMKPYLRGKNIRGLADLLHATAEVLEWLELEKLGPLA